MAEPGIPEDLLRFIHTSIASVPQLEALLLLRSDAAQDWDARKVAGRLYLPVPAVSALLVSLHEAGMVTASGEAYRYQPQSAELAAMIDRLAQAYAHDLVGVTRIIHSATGRKAQIFSDAFKFRKDS